MKKIFAAFGLMLLASCQTITPEQQASADRQTCRNYGFRQNNDAFATCMQRLDLERRQSIRANRDYFDAWQRDDWNRRHRYYF